MEKESKYWSIFASILVVSVCIFFCVLTIEIHMTKREFARQGLQYKTIPVPTYAYGNWVK